MEGNLYQDYKRTWLECWEPKTKTLAAFVWLMGMLFLENIMIMGILFVGLLILCTTSNNNTKQVYSSLKIVLPFVIFSTVTLIFSNGLDISIEAVEFAILLGLRVLSSAIVILMLVSTQPFQTYLDSMNSLNLPPVFMTTLFLTTRYTKLLMNELSHMQKALKSRSFKAKGNKNTINTYGNMCGGMIVKGIDRSEVVYKAMKSRGFSKTMPVEDPMKITKLDVLKLMTSFVFITAIVIIDKLI